MLMLKSCISVILVLPAFGTDPTASADRLVIHEWGTFTSVAAKNGGSARWAPLSGPADLPCFVNRLSCPLNIKLAEGLVRMETPVLYFYPQRSMTISVQVKFPEGWITEWYPPATRVAPQFQANLRNWPKFGNGQIDWNGIELLPGEHPVFPSSQGASRYYAARDTDSAPVGVRAQREKFIFYRGMANFLAPITASFDDDGNLTIRNPDSDIIPLLILFENLGGKVGFRFAHGLTKSITLAPPELTGSLEDLRQRMIDSLVEFGLYRKEAAAMLETWHDSWFEEGSRVFYIVPRAFVDSQLPLTITPDPVTLRRVFVGRVETLSPRIHRSLASALSTGDVGTLTKFSRFLDPFIEQIQANDSIVAQAAATRSYLDQARMNIYRELHAGSCVQ